MSFKGNPITYLVRTTWRYLEGEKRRWLLFVALSTAALLLLLFEPVVIGKLLNTFQTHADSPDLFGYVAFYAGLYFALQFGFWMLHGPARVIEREVAFSVRVAYQSRVFRCLTELAVPWHRDQHSGDIIDKVTRSSKGLFDFCDFSFIFIHMGVRFVGSLGMLMYFFPKAGLIVLCGTSVVLLLVVLFDKVLFNHYQSLNKRYNFLAKAVHDYLSNIITVLSLRLEKQVNTEVIDRLEDARPVFYQNVRVNEFKWFLTSMMVAVITVGTLVWFTWDTLSAGEAILAGTFFTLFEYLRRIGQTFFEFAWRYSETVRQAADLFGAEHILAEHESRMRSEESLEIPDDWKNIEISNLHFRYQDEKKRVHHLDGVDLSVVRGKSVALLGASGSGKSTLMSLMRGFHPPGRVQVSCDGSEVSSGLGALSRHTTLIPQDPEIFSDTIRFNITLGFERSEEDLTHVLKLSCFDSVLERLEKGLETDIAEKGVNLSGGERQRLALARGIFFSRSSSIILLDEPTSSVDIENEQKIYRGILREFRDRSVVSALHKLHLIQLFDYIYLFEDGEVVEKGTFAELSQSAGRFRALWSEYRSEAALRSASVL